MVDVNAVAPGSSAIAGFGVAADPEGATVPLFPAKRDDGSTMVVISGDGHDGLAAVDARERSSARLVGWLGDRGMTLRRVAIGGGSLGTLTLDWLAAMNWLWRLTTSLLRPCTCHLPSCVNII